MRGACATAIALAHAVGRQAQISQMAADQVCVNLRESFEIECESY